MIIEIRSSFFFSSISIPVNIMFSSLFPIGIRGINPLPFGTFRNSKLFFRQHRGCSRLNDIQQQNRIRRFKITHLLLQHFCRDVRDISRNSACVIFCPPCISIADKDLNFIILLHLLANGQISPFPMIFIRIPMKGFSQASQCNSTENQQKQKATKCPGNPCAFLQLPSCFEAGIDGKNDCWINQK